MLDLYVPQRNKSINDKTKCATAEQIAAGDIDNNLNKDDIIISSAKIMKKNGMSIEEIAAITKLSEDEIHNL